jgi:predicted ATP-grasp superfamily ATP-dependent carboligase
VRPRVIVLGADHPSALGIVQSLGRVGIPAVAVDTDPDARGFRSRYVEACHVVGPALEDTWAVLERLRPGGGLLMPTDDHFLTAIARRAESLGESFVVPVPPWTVMAPLLRRPRSLELAEQAGLRVPRWWEFRDAGEMDAGIAGLDPHSQYLVCRDDFSRPCVVDTAWGRSVKVSGPGIAAIRRDCHDVLARTGQLPVVTEIVPGASEDAVGVVALVDRTHDVVLSYCQQRRPLRTIRTGGAFIHPYGIGWAARCESMRDPEAEAATRALVRHVRYHGVAVVEFRRDARDGRLVFVKLDMRVDRSAGLSAALGRDISRATWDLFALDTRPAAPAAPYADGVAWLWLSRYLTDLVRNRTRISLGRELVDLAATARRTRALAFLGRGDLRPFLTDLGRWAGGWTRRGRGWMSRRLGRLRASAP